jgi:hypothetical protein
VGFLALPIPVLMLSFLMSLTVNHGFVDECNFLNGLSGTLNPNPDT